MVIKIPWTHARANAYMYCNELFGREKKKVKKQARREKRRFLKNELLEEISSIDLDPEIVDAVNENMWELLGEEITRVE